MPDVFALGLGGGSLVEMRSGKTRIGPRSVGGGDPYVGSLMLRQAIEALLVSMLSFHLCRYANRSDARA